MVFAFVAVIWGCRMWHEKERNLFEKEKIGFSFERKIILHFPEIVRKIKENN
jgi:hypothetical protein